MKKFLGISALALGAMLFSAFPAQAVDPPGLGGGAGGGIGGGLGLGGGRAGVRVNGQGGGRIAGPNFDAGRLGAGAGAAGRANAGGGNGLLSGRANLEFNANAEMNRNRRQEQGGNNPGEEGAPNENGRRTEVYLTGRQRAAMQADLTLAGRLADIDRLRDIALTQGDTNMLLRADSLEHEARVQHQNHVRQIMATQGEEGFQGRFEGNGNGGFQAEAGRYPYPERPAQFNAAGEAEGAMQGNFNGRAVGPYPGAVERRTDAELRAAWQAEQRAWAAERNARLQAQGEAEFEGSYRRATPPASRRYADPSYQGEGNFESAGEAGSSSKP